MKDYDDVIEKEVTNAKVVPYRNETITKPERKEERKHPWDIAQEIIAEQNQAALAVKWGILPLETLMDEQFLSILHAVEEITDVTPLREAAIQLPKKIYGIVRQYEQLKKVPAELTDQLIFDISKTYFYSVIESMCRLIKTIQQGQRTSLISLANIVQEQRDEIEKYQALLKLPEKVRQLQLGVEVKMEKLKRHVKMHLERMDKKTSITSVTISEIRSQVHKIASAIEESYEEIPEPNRPSWIFPGDIVELHAPEDDIIFHDKGDDETTTNGEQQQEESLTMSGETQEEHGNIPHGLNPLRQYIPAGAEGDEANSSTSTYGEEETVEEELAIILVIHHTGQPIPSSWSQWTQRKIGEMFPLYLCHHEPHRNFLNRQQSLKRGRGICKEEGKEEDKTGGEGIIISITWTIINNSKLKEEL